MAARAAKTEHPPIETALLINGEYDCSTCAPYKVKADGQDQPLHGNPYFDTIAIAIIDARTITKVGKKDGRVAADTKVVISADGAAKTEIQTLIGMAPVAVELTAKFSRVSAASPDHIWSRAAGPLTIEESDLKDGKVVKISRWALAPDGQTIHARFDDTHGHIQEQDGHKVK